MYCGRIVYLHLLHKKRQVPEEGILAKTKPHERVFAMTLALLFLGTTLATGVAVVWTIHKDNQTKNATTDTSTQDALDKLNDKGTKLEGTKLTGFTPVDSVPELQKIDTKEGAGDAVPAGATITAHYTGAVAATGVIFQSSHDSGDAVQFGLDQVIKGWTDGVPGMKVGGTRRLLIPAAQAYGATPPSGSGIPANADLVFDIELVSID